MRNWSRDSFNPSHRVWNGFFSRLRENNGEAENAEAEEYFESLCEWGFDQKEAETKIEKRGGSLISLNRGDLYIAAFYLY